MAMQTLIQPLSAVPGRSFLNDCGPLFVKRAIETSATERFGIPWNSAEMDAAIDVVIAARDPIDHLMNTHIRVMDWVARPVSTKYRHDSFLRSTNQSQDKNVREAIKAESEVAIISQVPAPTILGRLVDTR